MTHQSEDHTVSIKDIPQGTNMLAEPIGISLIYGIWLVVTGESWWWLVGSFIMLFAAIQVLEMNNWFRTGKAKREGRAMFIYQIFKVLLLIPATAIILRMAFISGFLGLFQSIPNLDVLGIVIALVALFLAAKLSPYYGWFVNL